ncbi:MAG: hypothetical protein RI580_02780 [Halothece sp. Uz-M2-17]|nr:hypothetical protein [Halothece sp. Uz-M2-17]
MKKLIFYFASVLLSTLPAQAVPNFASRNIQGLNVNVPQGWQVESDHYSIQLFADPSNEDAPTMGLIAATANQSMTITPAQVSAMVIQQIQAAAPTTQMQLVDQNDNGTALYQLHQLTEGSNIGYMSSYTYTDQGSGSMVYVFFTALAQDFVNLGGPALPLVAFGGLQPQAVANIQQQVTQNPASYQNNINQDQYSNLQVTPQNYEMLSQISAMSHETSMKILHNIGGGWCYRGEPNCY